MSDGDERNQRVFKFAVSFDLEFYAPSPSVAYARALDHMADLVMKHRKLRVWDVIEDRLPTGGVEGEPHGETLNGWLCVYSVMRAR